MARHSATIHSPSPPASANRSRRRERTGPEESESGTKRLKIAKNPYPDLKVHLPARRDQRHNRPGQRRPYPPIPVKRPDYNPDQWTERRPVA
ncbi:hypothetical protein SXCC_01173 [Gluconacetobacter sp. SXCC-1]|nr:hypothetical protein SXCC_01173 [Gluconacetobacter sp. SXCC-1]